MSGQEAFLRDLDATIVAGLVDAGLADGLAVYTPPGPDPTPIEGVRVVMDHDVQFFGDGPGQVTGTRTVVRLECSQVPAPAAGGTLLIGSRTWTLFEPISREPGISSKWTVTGG
jgi:hypothetical protein